MNPLKQRLLAGDFISAAWAEMGHPDTAEAMVRSGWPVIVIDGEHGIGDIEQWVAVARAVEAAGGEVVLRVPEGSETLLKRVLDRGFKSIMVPQVNSADQARAIASFCRYPPLGRRGYAAPIVRASHFGARSDYALQGAHDDLLLLVQCEHREAVDNLAEIAAVPGIDMVFVGPNDLSGSIAHLERLLDPAPQALLKRIEATAVAQSIALGTIVGAGRGWADLKRLGYRLVVGPNDVSLIVNGALGAAAERDSAVGKAATATARPVY